MMNYSKIIIYASKILFCILFPFLFFNCSSEKKVEVTHPVIYDKANILSDIEIDTLRNLNLMGADISILTIDTLFDNEIENVKTDFWKHKQNEQDHKEDRILIVGSKVPNCAYIFFEDNSFPICKHGYGSKDYYLTQINDTITTNQKIFEMVKYSMNSYLSDGKFESLKSEIVGYIYEYSMNSNSWVNKYIISKFMYVFIWITKYIGFFLSTILFCFFFYFLENYIEKKVLSLFPFRETNSTFIQILIIIRRVLLSLSTKILFYFLPISFTVLSVANLFCISGVEFLPIIESSSFSNILEIENMYISNWNSYSTLLAFITTILLFYSRWKDGYIFNDNSALLIIIVPFFYLGCRIIPIAYNWILICTSILAMPSALKQLNRIESWDNLYYSENGKISSERKNEALTNKISFLFSGTILIFVEAIYCHFVNNEPNYVIPQINTEVVSRFENKPQTNFSTDIKDEKYFIENDVEIVDYSVKVTQKNYVQLKINCKEILTVGEGYLLYYDFKDSLNTVSHCYGYIEGNGRNNIILDKYENHSFIKVRLRKKLNKSVVVEEIREGSKLTLKNKTDYNLVCVLPYSKYNISYKILNAGQSISLNKTDNIEAKLFYLNYNKKPDIVSNEGKNNESHVVLWYIILGVCIGFSVLFVALVISWKFE